MERKLTFALFLLLVLAILSLGLAAEVGAGKGKAPVKPAQGTPDLVVSTMEASSSEVDGGSRITILYSVKNTGDLKSQPSVTRFDFSGEDGVAVEHEVPALAPGAIYKQQMTYIVSKNGRYQVKATADYNNRIPESNEVNNQNSMEISIGHIL